MGISRKLNNRFRLISPLDKQKIIKMAWEDSVSYDDIEKRFGLSASDLDKFMRRFQEEKTYQRWKKRQKKKHKNQNYCRYTNMITDDEEDSLY